MESMVADFAPPMDGREFCASTLPVLRLTEILSRKVQLEGLSMRRDMLKTVETALLDLLPVVRRCMNYCSPVNRVPPELMSLIFGLCVDNADVETWPHSGLKSNRGLRSITHVCRHWRSLAIGTPVLWTNVHDRPVHRSTRNSVSTFLERSYPAPLNVLISEAPSSFFRALVKTHSKRIRELYFKAKASHELDVVHGLAPNLEHLTIHHRPEKASFARPIIFDEETPYLRTVALFKVPMLPGRQLRSLTHLAICDPGETSTWTMPDLINLLRSNSALEEIVLKDLPQLPMLDHLHTPAIELSRLRRLTLAGIEHSGLLSFFVENIRSSTTLAICVSDVPEECGRCSMSDIQSIRSLSRLHMRAEDQDTLTVTGANNTSAIRIDSTSVPFIFHSRDEEWLKRDNRTDSLWATWPLEELTELWLTGPSESRDLEPLEIQGGMVTMLEELKSLTTLVVISDYDSEEPEKDAMGLRWLLETSALLETCPETLTTLRLWVNGYKGFVSSIPVEDIARFAATRRNRGCPIRRLIIEGGRNILIEPDEVLDWADLASHVDSLEVRFKVEKPPEMELPEICTRGAHALWPSWE